MRNTREYVRAWVSACALVQTSADIRARLRVHAVRVPVVHMSARAASPDRARILLHSCAQSCASAYNLAHMRAHPQSCA